MVTVIPKTIVITIYFLLIIVTASTSHHHDLYYSTKQEKDRHTAQLTHKLQSVTREKVESQKTKHHEYEQQLLKTTGCKYNN